MPRFWLGLRRGLSKSIFAVAGAVVFVDLVGRPAKVEGRSMQPLFNPDANDHCDVVFLNRAVSFGYHKIKRGDVIALNSPKDPSQKLIKRVIALQGDSIRTLKGDELVHIPQGHMWVEGDNHEQSFDSNHFGPISMGLMVAKATHILWPPKRVSTIESTVPANRTPVQRHICQQCLQKEVEPSVKNEVANIFI